MYTPEGYLSDPPDARCPYCGGKKKVCSHIDSLIRIWGRDACKKKHHRKHYTLYETRF
jgi:hypothetical protein